MENQPWYGMELKGGQYFTQTREDAEKWEVQIRDRTGGPLPMTAGLACDYPVIASGRLTTSPDKGDALVDVLVVGRQTEEMRRVLLERMVELAEGRRGGGPNPELHGAVRWCLGAVCDWDWERGIRVAEWPKTVAGAAQKIADVDWGEAERSDYSWSGRVVEKMVRACRAADEFALQAAIEQVLKEGRYGDREPDRGA